MELTMFILLSVATVIAAVMSVVPAKVAAEEASRQETATSRRRIDRRSTATFAAMAGLLLLLCLLHAVFLAVLNALLVAILYLQSDGNDSRVGAQPAPAAARRNETVARGKGRWRRAVSVALPTLLLGSAFVCTLLARSTPTETPMPESVNAVGRAIDDHFDAVVVILAAIVLLAAIFASARRPAAPLAPVSASATHPHPGGANTPASATATATKTHGEPGARSREP